MKFFFVFSRGWKFSIGQMNHRKFPVRIDWGRVFEDKAMRPTATPTESRYRIVREWEKKNFESAYSEALLSEESMRVYLPPLGHVLLDDRVTLARPQTILT